jgi:hypothetical protein
VVIPSFFFDPPPRRRRVPLSRLEKRLSPVDLIRNVRPSRECDPWLD